MLVSRFAFAWSSTILTYHKSISVRIEAQIDCCRVNPHVVERSQFCRRSLVPVLIYAKIVDIYFVAWLRKSITTGTANDSQFQTPFAAHNVHGSGRTGNDVAIGIGNHAVFAEIACENRSSTFFEVVGVKFPNTRTLNAGTRYEHTSVIGNCKSLKVVDYGRSACISAIFALHASQEAIFSFRVFDRKESLVESIDTCSDAVFASRAMVTGGRKRALGFGNEQSAEVLAIGIVVNNSAVR